MNKVPFFFPTLKISSQCWYHYYYIMIKLCLFPLWTLEEWGYALFVNVLAQFLLQWLALDVDIWKDFLYSTLEPISYWTLPPLGHWTPTWIPLPFLTYPLMRAGDLLWKAVPQFLSLTTIPSHWINLKLAVLSSMKPFWIAFWFFLLWISAFLVSFSFSFLKPYTWHYIVAHSSAWCCLSSGFSSTYANLGGENYDCSL